MSVRMHGNTHERALILVVLENTHNAPNKCKVGVWASFSKFNLIEFISMKYFSVCYCTVNRTGLLSRPSCY